MEMNDKITVVALDRNPKTHPLFKLNICEKTLILFAKNYHDLAKKVLDIIPSCILIDLGNPEIKNIAAVHETRKETLSPLIAYNDVTNEDEMISSINSGADLYLKRDISAQEWLARISALVRRSRIEHQAKDHIIRLSDNLAINISKNIVIKDGVTLPLRSKERDVLLYLMKNANRYVPIEEILANVWGYLKTDKPEYVRLYVTYLRKKLEPDPSKPQYLLTDKGVGYMLKGIGSKTRKVIGQTY
ncbi:MAG: response regulator transcription factor [Methylacidiphilales bacterium]|nr:response regulator transcription factor [Candidatus Methylacidiphilales bacterium]